MHEVLMTLAKQSLSMMRCLRGALEDMLIRVTLWKNARCSLPTAPKGPPYTVKYSSEDMD